MRQVGARAIDARNARNHKPPLPPIPPSVTLVDVSQYSGLKDHGSR